MPPLPPIKTVNVAAMWSGLSADSQAAIGTNFLRHVLAASAAEDESLDATTRETAEDMILEAGNVLRAELQYAFPTIPWKWWKP